MVPSPFIKPEWDQLRELDPELRQLIETLNDDELALLQAIGNRQMLQKNSIREQTLRKRLPPKRKAGINVGRVCRQLANKGFLHLYRPGNWQLTTRGKLAAAFLYRCRAERLTPGLKLT